VPRSAPAGPRRVEPLNLAHRPFLNSRPVVRVSLLLWLLGLALLVANVSLFWTFTQSSVDKRAQIARGEEDIQRQQTADQQLQRILDSFNLEQQNERVDFLNKKIAERTFSWSQLLDQVAAALPNDVRLNRLSPLTGDKAQKEFERSRTKRGRDVKGRVPMLITGQARSDEALWKFVDNLYRYPFAEPNPLRDEREDEGNLLKFEISVQYIPTPPGGAVIEEVPAPAVQEMAAPGAAGSTATGAPAAAPAAAPGGRP
ncbi:MAG: hypothetical protein ACJ75H_19180, partial [Thermoanaerobaculia bacterium]